MICKVKANDDVIAVGFGDTWNNLLYSLCFYAEVFGSSDDLYFSDRDDLLQATKNNGLTGIQFFKIVKKCSDYTFTVNLK